MNREELLDLLRQYMGTSGSHGDKLIEAIIRQINAGLSLSRAIDKALSETAFTAGYFNRLIETICTAALLGYGIKAPSMEMKASMREYVLSDAWAHDKMKLSKRLHGTSKQMRQAIIDTVAVAMRKSKAVTQMSMDLYDGYNSGKKVLRGAELPQYLARLVAAARSAAGGDLSVNRDFNLAARQAQKQLTKMQPPDKALKAAYQQLVDAAQRLSEKAMEKAVWVAVQEKARFYADRIAVTEAARAWSDTFFVKNYSDPMVIGFGWRLSSRHPRVDICDFHAKVDHYGMGLGNYPKDKMPPHPAHPFCTCNLVVIYKGEAVPDAFNPEAGAAWLKAQSPDTLRKMLSIDGANAFMKDGKWQKHLRYWQGHADPKPKRKLLSLFDDKIPNDIEKWYNKIVKAEPQITQTVQTAVAASGGKMEGLEYRIKTKDSYLRKLETDFQSVKQDDPSITKLRIAATIHDAIRYTAIADERSLYKLYGQVLEKLQDDDYQVLKVKNTWLEKLNPYKGINVIFRSPQGQSFELQFHTSTSYDLKQNQMHRYYEEFRLPTTPAKRREELRLKMLELSERLSVPDDIEQIHSRR